MVRFVSSLYKAVRIIKREYINYGIGGDRIDSEYFLNNAERYPLIERGFCYMKRKVVEEFGVFAIEI
jgi:hypothetical protein